MRVVLDTNVFVSGIFFSGPPAHILRAWRNGRIEIVYSPAIFLEYERVVSELGSEFPGVSGRPFLDLLAHYGELVYPGHVAGVSCRDPEDLKFLDYLLHSKAQCLVTGDKDLVDAQVRGAVVLTPRQFYQRYL